VVKVEEPDEDRAIRMIRGITESLERHHGVRVLAEAVESAVKLSHRYIPARQLSDKSVSLLDTACARVAIGQAAIPPAVEDSRRRIDHLLVERGILDRERATGGTHDERTAEVNRAFAEERERLARLEDRWREERDRVEAIRALAQSIEAHYLEEKGGSDGPDAPPHQLPGELLALQAEVKAKMDDLRAVQGESPLLHVSVDAQTIAEVVAGWTGIPVGKMLADEIQTVLDLRARLEERVIGQSHALEAIARRIQTARANLTDPRRPIGVFLLVAPSGVGKTETALALAEALDGGERNLITINMSEYQDAHTVSGLKGSPPGYVGYGEGGILTEAVRRRPKSVVLLDEVEKAHPDVLEPFFLVFDKGTLEDGEGREIDFKNTVILLTTNVATDTILALCKDPEAAPDPEALAEAVRPDLLHARSERGVPIFKQAFPGRLIVVPYYPISDAVMRRIVRPQLGHIARRMWQNHRAQLTYGDELVEAIAGRCREVQSGARNVDHILTRTLLPEISREVLARIAEGRSLREVRVDVDGQGGLPLRDRVGRGTGGARGGRTQRPSPLRAAGPASSPRHARDVGGWRPPPGMRASRRSLESRSSDLRRQLARTRSPCNVPPARPAAHHQPSIAPRPLEAVRSI
jgi:type VI secretion system protein VasG